MEFRLTPSRRGHAAELRDPGRATDAAPARRFDRYWLIVGPGSSAIRWELLTAVALRAESSAGVRD